MTRWLMLITLCSALFACGTQDANDAADGGHGDGPAADALAPDALASTVLTSVPLPDDPLLLVSGDQVGNPNSAEGLHLGLDDLQGIADAELTVTDKLDDEEATFTGVRFVDLLRFVGASPSSDVYLHALDEYALEHTAADLVDAGAVIAITDDGAPIDLGNGGPVRLVFPAGTEFGDTFDNWIWSLDEVRLG